MVIRRQGLIRKRISIFHNLRILGMKLYVLNNKSYTVKQTPLLASLCHILYICQIAQLSNIVIWLFWSCNSYCCSNNRNFYVGFWNNLHAFAKTFQTCSTFLITWFFSWNYRIIFSSFSVLLCSYLKRIIVFPDFALPVSRPVHSYLGTPILWL